MHHIRKPVPQIICGVIVAVFVPGVRAEQVLVHAALEADPSPDPIGAKPYEMKDRREPRTPLSDFSRLEGWEVEGHNAEGWLYPSSEQQLYADRCGKLTYLGNGKDPWLLVRPVTPIVIPEPWDAIDFWSFGNNWSYIRDPKTPPLKVQAIVRDAMGRQFEVDLGRIDSKYWFMMHGRLPARPKEIQRPLHFVGLRFSNAGNSDKRTVYLGPAYFYNERLGSLTFETLPDSLPFPTRPETILPINKTSKYRNSTHAEGDGAVFTYTGPDCTLEYRYAPTDGTLGDIELRAGGRSIRPCVGGGLTLLSESRAVAPGDPSIRRTLKEHAFKDDALHVTWQLDAGAARTELEYRLRIHQKSLIIDISASQPIVTDIALGRCEGITAGKLFRFPYLTYGGNDPRALYADGLFFFSQFDWFVSDASRLSGAAAIGPGWSAFNGGASYGTRTDGTRNRVRERLFLTASPDVQEVLPTIPNPPSPMRDVQAARAWRPRFGADHAGEIADAKRLRALGCDQVTARYHEESWRDTGESFTLRLDAAPAKGGDDALRKFVQAIQSLGWRIGLYTNYIDFAPVNAFWNEDWVARLPDGNWRPAWTRCWTLKPTRAVEMEAKLAPQIGAKFGSNHSYCDVLTCLAPFDVVDFDARVPGAGTFRKTFECYGRLLHNEKTAYRGPVYSEGMNHWWYAGLVDGNYAQIQSGSPHREPLLVDFDLLKMHPLEMDAGMGDPGMFFRGAPVNNDQFIATTIAYGHLAFLAWDPVASMKPYYMIQPLQKRYAMVPVAKIEYADASGMRMDTSRALITDAYLCNRVHVVYDNGTEVYVNGHSEPWTVSGPRGTFELPQWGYAAWRPDDRLLVCSARPVTAQSELCVGTSERVDFCMDDGQAYADSRGGFAFLGQVAIEGAGAIKKDGDDWWIIPGGKLADFAFAPELIDTEQELEVEAINEDGSPAQGAETRWSRGMFHVLPGAKPAFKYRVRGVKRPRPVPIASEALLGVQGEEVRITPPAGTALFESAFWEASGVRTPVVLRPDNGAIIARVPRAMESGTHAWLGVVTDGQTRWVDFLIVEPLSATLQLLQDVDLSKGDPLNLQLCASSHVNRKMLARIRCETPGDVSCRAEPPELPIPPQGSAQGTVRLALPWRTGKHDVSVTLDVGDITKQIALSLTTEWSSPLVFDLLDPNLPMTKGYRRRNGAESPGMRVVEDGACEPVTANSGGVQRRSLFLHPPYGAGGTGYAFAVYDLDLPREPAVLEFWMGMRDGLDRSDGVTWKVVAIAPSSPEKELFSAHYADLRWQHVQVPLPAGPGKIRLKLVADAGPSDDSTADHALWGEPRIVLAEQRLHCRRPEHF